VRTQPSASPLLQPKVRLPPVPRKAIIARCTESNKNTRKPRRTCSGPILFQNPPQRHRGNSLFFLLNPVNPVKIFWLSALCSSIRVHLCLIFSLLASRFLLLASGFIASCRISQKILENTQGSVYSTNTRFRCSYDHYCSCGQYINLAHAKE